MKKSVSYGFAVTALLSLAAQNIWMRKTRETRTIEGNYNDTARIAPTNQRIKTLKLPAGFALAKFAEIANPRILAVSDDGTVYVSQRTPGTLSMLGNTNGDGAAGRESKRQDRLLRTAAAACGQTARLSFSDLRARHKAEFAFGV
jgi:hypothetical protein